MRFLLAVAVALVSISMTSAAQQNNSFKTQPNDSFKVKHIPDKGAKKTSVPTGKAPTKSTSSTNAKDLKSLEHQTARSTAAPRSGGKKSAQLKQVKDKPNPPMNFGAKGGGKNAGLTKQASNPYKGRLKQKHSR